MRCGSDKKRKKVCHSRWSHQQAVQRGKAKRITAETSPSIIITAIIFFGPAHGENDAEVCTGRLHSTRRKSEGDTNNSFHSTVDSALNSRENGLSPPRARVSAQNADDERREKTELKKKKMRVCGCVCVCDCLLVLGRGWTRQ
jgi:hypothetical protein